MCAKGNETFEKERKRGVRLKDLGNLAGRISTHGGMSISVTR